MERLQNPTFWKATTQLLQIICVPNGQLYGHQREVEGAGEDGAGHERHSAVR